MASFKVTLKDKRKDGQYNLKILLVHNKKNAYIKTDYHLFKNQLRNGRVVNHPNARLYNKKLYDMIYEFENRIEVRKHIEFMTALEVKKYITEKDNKNNIDFFEYIDDLLIKLLSQYRSKLKMEGKASKRTYESYRTLRNRLESFIGEPVLSAMKINKVFLEKFEEHLRNDGVKAGIWNYMKDLRSIYNRIIQDELIDPGIYPFKFYNIGKLKKQSEPKILEVEILRNIFDYVPKNEFESMSKDIFQLDFYLIGINAVDLYHLEYAGGRIEADRIYFDRSKTEVIHSIRIEPEALKLMERLRGKEEYFIFQERYTDHRNFTQYLNKFLRRIADEMGIPRFTLGYARYTWATIAYNECEISDSIIDFALGHKGNKTLAGAHYIKKKRNLMDEANRKVIDYVLGIENGRIL